MGFILERYRARLQEFGMYRLLRATEYRISNNHAQFFAVLESYCLSTSPFLHLIVNWS